MKGIGGFVKTNPDDLERVVEKSDTSSSIVSDDVIKPPQTTREHLLEILHSSKFQIVVICLVLLDCLLVISELLIELKAEDTHNGTTMAASEAYVSNDEQSAKHISEGVEEEKSAIKIAEEVLHYFSIAILSIFLLELSAKLFAMGKQFFHHKLEIVDAFIVIVSFILDIAFINDDGVTSALGLLVLLRLWRIGRVVNGMYQ